MLNSLKTNLHNSSDNSANAATPHVLRNGTNIAANHDKKNDMELL